MTEGEPKRILVGVYEGGGVHHLVVPREVLKAAEAKLDAERQRLDAARQARERLAREAKTQALQQARARGRLKKAMRMCFKWGARK